MQYFGTPLRDGRIDESLRELNYNVSDSDIAYEDLSTRLRTEWRLSPNLVLTNTAYFLESNRHWRNVEEYYLDETTQSVERQVYIEILHRQEQVGDQFTASFNQDLDGRANTLVVGVDFNRVEFKHINNSPYGGSSVVPVRGFAPGQFINLAGTFPKYSTETQQYAVFFEDRLQLFERWSVIAGARYDDNDYEHTSLLDGSSFEGNFADTTWRVGVVFQPRETLSLYAQYATAVDPIGSLASLSAQEATLDLATGTQIELGLKQQLFDNRLEWTLALYDIVKKDLLTAILSTPDPDDAAQIGEQSSRGVEVALAYTINDQWRIDANATVVDAQYESFGANTGNTPEAVPEELANLWGSWQFLDAWRARAGLRYVGERYVDASNTTRVPSYIVVDVALDWAATEALTLGAHVRKATDKTYAQASYGPQFILGMPRTWELQTRFRF